MTDGDPGSGLPARPHRAGPGRAVRIGLTGPIGCGKSTVAGWLADLGARVIDADHVARGVTPPGSPELAAVVEAFGTGVLHPDGQLDRAALGRVAFADPAALRRLEAIIHPAVRPRILASIAAAERDGVPGIVVEAIKLIEGGLASLCDEVWLVTCDPADQRARLAARGLAAATALGGRTDSAGEPGAGEPTDSARVADAGGGEPAHGEAPSAGADAEARIAAQGDLVTRLTPFATRILDTSGTVAASRSRVVAAWSAAIASRH